LRPGTRPSGSAARDRGDARRHRGAGGVSGTPRPPSARPRVVRQGKSAAILFICRNSGPPTTDDRHPRLPTKPIRGFKRVCEFSASSVEILSRTRAACASTFSSRSQSFRLLSRERSF
jgi:hypothetical protein